MGISWDETSPGDTSSIPAFPANERAFRATVKTTFGVEHDEADGGRHSFGFGDATARDAITTWKDGAIWFLLISAGLYKQQLYVTASGNWIDAVPPTQYANRTAAGSWSAPQSVPTATIVPGAGTPMTIAVGTSEAPYRKVTLTANSKMSNPSGWTANTSATVEYEILQNGTGGWTLTFDTNYVFAGRATPIIATAASARSLLILKRLDDGKWLASVLPDIGV